MQTETLLIVTASLAVLVTLLIVARMSPFLPRQSRIPRDASLSLPDGRQVPINRTPFLLGRGSANAINIEGALVSRRHAAIAFARDQFVLRDGWRDRSRDVESKNGTYVNGQRVREVILKPGDQITIGAVAFIFRRAGHAEVPIPPQPTPDSDEMPAVRVPDPNSAANAPVVGDYTITEKIGVGGMATVYKGVSRRDGRTLAAIKVLKENDSYIKDKFYDEARIGQSLNHIHIAHVYAYGQIADTYYIAMEYVEGGTLRDRLVLRQPLTLEQVVVITGQVCEGLAYAASKRVVHRDIKPENLMWDPRVGMKIIDFGIARIASRVTQTSDGKLIGTPYYMSCEQAQGESNLDGRSDIYSMGVVLYELLTGRPPFDGEPLAVVHKHLTEQPLPPRHLNPAIPEQVEHVVLNALVKDPSQRYQNAMQMASELGYRTGMMTHLPPLPPRTVTPKPIIVSPDQFSGRSHTGQLLVVRGRTAGARIAVPSGGLPLRRNMIDPSDVLITREHARIFVQAGRFWLQDLDSRNGTFLNGQRIAQASALQRGDEIRIGNTVLQFEG